MNNIHVSGKRKTAIARAIIKSGSGIVRVNNQLLQFFNPAISARRIEEPLLLAGDIAKKIDIDVIVNGSGVATQASATRLAIAKALVKLDKSLQQTFNNYDRSLLVSDVRIKETRKPNRHGKARAKVQKSYR